jgi:hypothetical protein
MHMLLYFSYVNYLTGKGFLESFRLALIVDGCCGVLYPAPFTVIAPSS